MRKIAILASGGGTLAEAIFEAVEKKELQCSVEALICDQPNAPVITRAGKYNIPVHLHPMVHDRQLWNRELLHRLQSLELDLVVSAGFMRILDGTVTSSLPIINSHPALLPYSRAPMRFVMHLQLGRARPEPQFTGLMKA